MVASSASRNEVSVLLATSLMFAGIAYLTTSLSWADGDPSAIRLAGALLLGVLLRRRPAVPWLLAYLFCGWLAWVGASLLAGRDPGLSALYGLVRLLEIALAYSLLRMAHLDNKLLRLSDLVKLLGATVVIAPFFGALVAAAVDWEFRGSIAMHVTMSWWTGNAVGMLTLLPAILAWDPDSPWDLSRFGANVEALFFLILTALVTWTSLFWSENAFVLISLPLLWAAFRLNLVGSALMALVVIISVLAAHRWWLPLSRGLQSNDGSPMGFQAAMFFGLCSVLPSMLIAVIERVRQAMAKDLLQLANRIGLIADNVPALIGYIGRDCRYQFANQRYAEWFGRPAAEIVGMRQDELLKEASASLFSEHLRSAFAGERQVFEAQVTGRDLEVTYVPDLRAGGDAGVFVMGHDITGRKLAEKTLFEEKERAQVTLDSIGDAVVACDTDMRITSLNPIAEDMTGWVLKEAIGKAFVDVVQLVDLESGELALSPMKIAIAENRIVGLQANSALLRRDGMRSPIEDSAAPIRNRQGAVLGGVMVFHDVSESRAMALKMSHMAQHDYLTDLPNRVLLQDRLLQALATVDRIGGGALLFADLDHFKRINESLSHEIGDVVLQQVARRLVETMRSDDTVSRQGGDEFVLLLPRLADPRDAAKVAKKVIDAIEAPFCVGGKDLHISASIGIALFPEDATEVNTLIKQADIALYHAKQEGRGRFSYFASSMSSQAERRMQLETDLRTALGNGDFFLVYQPKVRMPGGEIIGMEALVRWRRSGTGEIVSPAEFIPAAEENGLIVALDEWVMREACRQNRLWQVSGLRAVPVSVNVSLSRFDPERLLQQVRNILAETGLSPECLEIEFTESAMFTQLDGAQQLIEQLKDLGVKVAMDDFGTGYSSLSSLAGFRFDTIKIDQSFVRGLPDDSKRVAIVQAIISMAIALKYGVIAEGVETDAQSRCLEKLGCAEMQGYLYSWPVSGDDFSGLLCDGVIVPPGQSPASPHVAP